MSLNTVLTIFLIQFSLSLGRVAPEVKTRTGSENFPTECETPGRETGFCVSASQCSALVEYLRQHNTNSDYMKWKCGPKNEDKNNPKVCCKTKWIESNQNTNNATTTVPNTSVPMIIHNEITRPATPTNWPRPSTSIPITSELPLIEAATNNATLNFPKKCGQQSISIPSRIFGGDETPQGEFPWMAQLMRRTDEGEIVFSCTGALITSKVVLTAAHCLVASTIMDIGSLYAVDLGDLDTDCSSSDQCLFRKFVLVSSYTPHENYSSRSRNHDHDIGLVFLRNEISFTDYISPICLLENVLPPEQNYYVAGWGKTETQRVSPKKLKALLPYFQWNNCVDMYKKLNISLTERQICAGGVKNKDTCQGDSGGPLMAAQNNTWYIAGVVSFGVSCGREGWPGVYVHIPNYIDWINATILAKFQQQ